MIKIEDYLDSKQVAFFKVALGGLGLVFVGGILGTIMKAVGLAGSYNLPVVLGFLAGCIYVGWFATKGYPNLRKIWEKRDEYLDKLR